MRERTLFSSAYMYTDPNRGSLSKQNSVQVQSFVPPNSLSRILLMQLKGLCIDMKRTQYKWTDTKIYNSKLNKVKFRYQCSVIKGIICGNGRIFFVYHAMVKIAMGKSNNTE